MLAVQMVDLSNQFESLDKEVKSLKEQLAIIIRKIATSYWREENWTTIAATKNHSWKT